MKLTKAQGAALRRKVDRLVIAARNDEIKGGGDPDDIPEIERELDDAERAVEKYIKTLEAK